MRNLKKAFTLFLIIIAFNLNAQKKENKEQKFKNNIELCVKNISAKINPLIQKVIVQLKAKQPNSELIEMYNEAKLSIKNNKEFINSLNELDTKINLKEETLKYIEESDKLLEIFLFPSIKVINGNLTIEKDKINEMFLQVQSEINESQILSDKIELFCKNHKLKREISVYDKNEYNEMIEKVKNKMEN